MELFFSNQIDGTLVQLDEEESGHCVKVLRHRVGDEIQVIDGTGTLFHCRLTDDSPKHAAATVLSEERDFGSHPYRLTMAVCPTKNVDRFEWFAEKATEIGVDVIAPVIGDHSERKVLKTERLRRLVLSASKQSLKAAVPMVAEPVSVSEMIKTAPTDALRLIAYCFNSDTRISISDALAGNGFSGVSEACRTRDIYVLIGPEGDFSQEEASLAISLGWIPIHLGDSRLRTETAALVATTSVYLQNM